MPDSVEGGIRNVRDPKDSADCDVRCTTYNATQHSHDRAGLSSTIAHVRLSRTAVEKYL